MIMQRNSSVKMRAVEKCSNVAVPSVEGEIAGSGHLRVYRRLHLCAEGKGV